MTEPGKGGPGLPGPARRWRDLGYWRGETLGAFLRGLADRHGERTAVVDAAGVRLSYADLDRRADRLAAGFAGIGVAPGDRVVVQLPNAAAFVEVCFALWRRGAVPVFALPAHRSSEIGYYREHTAATAYVVADRHDGFDYRTLAAATGGGTVVVAGDPGPYTALEDLYRDPMPQPAPDPAGLALLQLSGGSTGRPKLIPRTHDDYLYSVRASAEICALTPEDRYLCLLPAAHNFALSSPGVLGALHAGGTVVLAPRPDPRGALAQACAEGVTVTALVPPLLPLWLDVAAGLDTLRLVQVGGARLVPDLAAEAVERLHPARLQQVFGMAEGLVNYTRLDDPVELVTTTQGRPICPHDEIRVVDDADEPVTPGRTGHLLTRGPYTIRGYYRARAHDAIAFTSDGFYRTGDLVRQLPSGHLVVEGRAKDQINRGGEKIAAAEVEEHLLAHPGVTEAALVAAPDPVLGERSCAFVVVADDGDPPRPAQLRAFVRGRGLAGYKVPDRIELSDALPRTAIGKIDKTVLRTRAAGKE